MPAALAESQLAGEKHLARKRWKTKNYSLFEVTLWHKGIDRKPLQNNHSRGKALKEIKAKELEPLAF